MEQHPHPDLVMIEDPGRAETGHVKCNAPLYGAPAFTRQPPQPIAYCGRWVKPGKRHRGKHRIEWTRRITGEER